MRVDVLIENTINDEEMCDSLICEHGLSMYIEYRDKKYLLDAGSTSAFIDNAKKMNINLENVDKSILSHGHYDHSGGFCAYFAQYEDKKLYAMKDAMNVFYSGSGGNIHEIGIPKEILDEYMDRFIFIEEMTSIDEGVYLVPHSSQDLEVIAKKAKLYKLENNEIVPEDFSHEMSLVFKTSKGLVVFNSCSHAGLINIVTEVMAEFPQDKIYAYVGGLHMKDTYSEEEVKKISKLVKEHDIKKIYTGHCTGEEALKILEKSLGDRVERLYTGKGINI